MIIKLRLEEEKDNRVVEELTRDAFWNVYIPGCCEHLIVHNLRKAKEFIAELNFAAIHGNKIIGNIVYAETKIKDGSKEHTVLTFGPLSVLPEYQNKGIGGQLITHTAQLAKKMSYKAIIIYGHPAYYKRFGFREAKEYSITNRDKKYPAALLALELYPDALNGISGVFDEGKAYEIDEKELENFEKEFDKKEKRVTESQKRFIEIANKYL